MNLQDNFMADQSEQVVVITDRELRNLRTMASRVDEMQGRCTALKIECDDLRVQLREVTAAADRLVNERDAARRELAERDEREREAEAGLPRPFRWWRQESEENRCEVVFRLRDDATSNGDAFCNVAASALEALATAPATAIAAVLPATAEDAAERADEKYLRCEACGHEEGEPFAPGDSHAGCDGPLLCVTCGTGIATPHAEPDEAMVERLCEVAVRAWNKTPRRLDSSYQPWPEAVRAILADLAATESLVRDEAYVAEMNALANRYRDERDDLARRLADCEAERDVANERTVEALALAGKHSVRAEEAEAELAELRAARQPAPFSDEEVERLAEAASYQRHYMEDPVDWRAIVRAVLAHPLVASRMTGEPQRIEATGPLVDAIGRIMRNTIDHEPDFRRGAERIAAEVARRLPTVDEVARWFCVESPDIWHEEARDVLALVRDRLGLGTPDPEREEPSEPAPCIRPAPWNGSQQPSEPEPDGTWATLPMQVRNVVYEWERELLSDGAVRMSRNDLAAVLHRWKAERADESYRLTEAAKRIVARYGSPPTVPVLALPSVEEVDEAVRNELRRPGSLQVGRIRNAVLDLVRSAQPEELQWWAKLSAATRTEATQAIRRAPGPVAALAIAADLLDACGEAQPGAKGDV
jgi:hypothetical protein